MMRTSTSSGSIRSMRARPISRGFLMSRRIAASNSIIAGFLAPFSARIGADLLEVDEGDAEVGPLAAAQMRRRFDDRDFERGSHDALQEMDAAHRTVLEPEHGMHVKARLAVVASGDVTQKT